MSLGTEAFDFDLIMVKSVYQLEKLHVRTEVLGSWTAKKKRSPQGLNTASLSKILQSYKIVYNYPQNTFLLLWVVTPDQ